MARCPVLHMIGGEAIGGAEEHVLTLLENLNQHDFAPVLICLIDGKLAPLARQHGILTEIFPMRHPLDVFPVPQITAWARRHGIALIHTHGSRGNLLGRLSAKLLGIPCVSTVHSSLAHDYLSPWAARLAIGLDRLTLPLTAGIITVSGHLAREVTARGGKRIKTIYNGQRLLPHLDKPALRLQYRRLWQIPAASVVIGSISRFHPTKGLAYLIQAMVQLQREIPNCHLLIIGEGPLFRELERQCIDNRLNFTLTGYIPQAYEALPAMDLFVLPSVSEGAGLVLLEAMQAGVPIVATHAGGIPELVDSGREAILVPPADPQALAKACASVLRDPQLALRLVLSGEQRWPQFSVQNMVEETEHFYHEILDTGE